MSRTNMLGIIGGVLIAISVFFSGDTARFNSSALSGGTAIMLFAAGLLVVLFLVLNNRTWAAYATIAATTILLIALIDGGLSITVGFVILLIGIILAFIATVSGRRGSRA